jgi:hypothetical protein
MLEIKKSAVSLDEEDVMEEVTSGRSQSGGRIYPVQ